MSSKNNVEYMFGHIPFLHWVHVWCAAACWGDITNRHPHAVRHAEWARDGCEKSSCRWPKTLPGRRGVALFFVDLFDLRNIGSEHLTELSSFFWSKVTHFIPENLFLSLLYIEVKVDGAHPKVKDPYSCHVVCLSSLILQNSCFFFAAETHVSGPYEYCKTQKAKMLPRSPQYMDQIQVCLKMYMSYMICSRTDSQIAV